MNFRQDAKALSLVNQAVSSINSPLSLYFFPIIFNILFSNVKNDGKEKIMLKVSLIDQRAWFTRLQSSHHFFVTFQTT